jgi:hypothetical protein
MHGTGSAVFLQSSAQKKSRSEGWKSFLRLTVLMSRRSIDMVIKGGVSEKLSVRHAPGSFLLPHPI